MTVAELSSLAETSSRKLVDSTTMKERIMSVDAGAMRRSVRLIHCLQQERGATCAVSASSSSSSSSSSSFADILERSRVSTDRAFVRCSSYAHHAADQRRRYRSWRTALSSVRERSSSSSSSRRRSSCSFRDVVVDFNALLAEMSDGTLRAPYAAFADDDVARVRRRRRRRRRRSISHAPSLRRDDDVAAASSSPRRPTPHSWGPLVSGVLDRDDDEPPSSLDQHRQRARWNDGEEERHEPFDRRRRNEEEEEEDDDDARSVADLLSLLVSSVRLKESTGIGRSLLTAVLLLRSPNDDDDEDDDDDGVPDVVGSGVVSDLVLEIERQRSLSREVRRKAEAYGPWLAQFAELDPELTDIHNFVRVSDFDMATFREATDGLRFWNLATAHMERLHAQELLVVEEIESRVDAFLGTHATATTTARREPSTPGVVVDADGRAGAAAARWILSAMHGRRGIGNAVTTPTEALDVVRSLDAQSVKSRLLSLVERSLPTTTVVGGVEVVAGGVEGSSKPSVSDDGDDGAAARTTTTTTKNEWEVDLDEVVFRKRIGRGISGTTYLGKWRGQDVAIKVAAGNETGVEGWNAEVQALQRLHHNNIIRLLGSIRSPPPVVTRCLVLEYCDGGDLTEALEKPTPPDFVARATRDMANGISYLHDRGVLHRDIKPENVLVHGDMSTRAAGRWVVKLTDFGLSTEIRRRRRRDDDDHDHDDDDEVELSAETGTYRWMAPEVVRHQSYSYEADVYSFSLVVWSLLTREDPFADRSQLQAAARAADGDRPPFPTGTPAPVARFLERGWHRDPGARPRADEFRDLFDHDDDHDHDDDRLTDDDRRWLTRSAGHPVYDAGRVAAMVPVRSSNNNNNSDHHDRDHDHDDGGPRAATPLRTPAAGGKKPSFLAKFGKRSKSAR